ncbi:MAG: hypothetical protein H8D55_01260 [Deltaproteobacteria bacterium]|nr:hypothetical protein [Deltaproteobacteria bacterium]
MKKEKMYRYIWQTYLHPGMWKPLGLLLVLILLFGGCANYQQRIKTYISGQEEIVAFPLRQVMLISGRGLKDLNFTITSIEFMDMGGLIQAAGPNAEATLQLRGIDRRMTRLRGEVFTKEGMRDISSEKELFRHISDLLTNSNMQSLKDMTAEMITVHKSPDADSRVVAYLARGVVVSVKGDESGWSNILLMSGATGYVLSTNLNPAPDETRMDIPEM